MATTTYIMSIKNAKRTKQPVLLSVRAPTGLTAKWEAWKPKLEGTKEAELKNRPCCKTLQWCKVVDMQILKDRMNPSWFMRHAHHVEQVWMPYTKQMAVLHSMGSRLLFVLGIFITFQLGLADIRKGWTCKLTISTLDEPRTTSSKSAAVRWAAWPWHCVIMMQYVESS